MFKRSMPVSNIVAVWLVLVLVTIVAVMWPVAAAENESTERRIITTGRSEIAVAPDIVTVTLGAQVTARTAVAAQNDVAKRMDAVKAALRQMGIKDADIQTGAYRVGPEYDYNNNERILKGYTVTHQLNVKMKNLSQLGMLFDAVISGGATTIDNVQFSTSKSAELQQQALKAAVEDARTRAAALAAGAGVENIRIVRIQDETPQVYAPMMDGFAAMKMASAPARTEIAPGEVTVTATVSVEFAF